MDVLQRISAWQLLLIFPENAENTQVKKKKKKGQQLQQKLCLA